MVILRKLLFILIILYYGRIDINCNGTEVPTESNIVIDLAEIQRRAMPPEIFPSQLNVQYFAAIIVEDIHVCCGVCVKADWILSVAQCISIFFIRDFTVAMGSRRADGRGGVFRKVKRVIVHEKFDNTIGGFDIALLNLDKPYEVGETIAIMDIESKLDYDWSDCHMFGWGLTLREGEFLNGSDVLETTIATLLPQQKCVDFCKRNDRYYISSAVLCAGEDNHMCMADFGSAIVCSNMLVGLASIVPSCAREDPIIFTIVPFYFKWVENAISNESFASLRTAASSLYPTNRRVYVLIYGCVVYNNIK